MTPRRPDFDFSNSHAHWARNPEFAHFYNAISVALPALERFLNKAMAKAAARLPPDDEDTRGLRRDVRNFIRQESNHYLLHERFNDVLKRDGYDISGLEEMIDAEYDKIWNTRSFAFCLAYCEGFETIGPPAAYKVLDGLEDMYEGADPEVVSLWKWHLMEEFEHRTVCYDVFKHFHGGYFLRVYGLFFQAKHLGVMVGKVRKFLVEQDRAHMSAQELSESERRFDQASKAMRRDTLKGLLRAVLPWYSPRQLAEPHHYREMMRKIEPRVS